IRLVDKFKVGSSRPGRHSGTRDGDCDDRTAQRATRFVAVLKIPPVDSPQTAVKMAIYSDIKKGEK
ncbi:MAG: hypothetical protein ABSG87_10245, partial [Verrucomicrobiota bacterium]